MRSIALAVAALLLLASCSDDPEPIEPPASPSTNPTDVPPVLPDSAREDTPAGAANFVKHWVETSNYAAHTGDTSELKDLSEADCGGCSSYVDLYESTYSNGGYFKGGDRTIGDLDLEAENGEVFVRADLNAAPGSYRKSKAASERKSKSEVTAVVFAVRFADDAWRMTQVGLAPKG